MAQAPARLPSGTLCRSQERKIVVFFIRRRAKGSNGSRRSPGPDHVIELMVVEGKAVLEQDGVVLGGVQFAVGHIGDLQVLEDATTFQLKLPEVRDLVWRLIRPMGKCSRDIRQQKGDQYTPHSQHGLHRSPLVQRGAELLSAHEVVATRRLRTVKSHS